MKYFIILPLFFLVISLHAQQPFPGAPERPDIMMMKNMENEILVRMINELEITDEQLPVFISKFREMAQAIRQQKETQSRIAEEIRSLIDREASPSTTIEEKISEFEKTIDKNYENMKNFRQDLKKILTSRQQAKFVLFFGDINNLFTPQMGLFQIPPAPAAMERVPAKPIMKQEKIKIPSSPLFPPQKELKSPLPPPLSSPPERKE